MYLMTLFINLTDSVVDIEHLLRTFTLQIAYLVIYHQELTGKYR